MAVREESITRLAAQLAEQARPLGSIRFDWAVAALSIWLVGGVYLDGWAHLHLDSALETFFTPWHGVLYSGYLAVAALLVATAAKNLLQGRSWRRALPAGYEGSLLGVAIFGAGGAGDVIWHLVFGIENDAEALLSPTHLLLALGVALIATGPLRAAWRRADADAKSRRWTAWLPVLISLTLLLSLLTFFTDYIHPFGFGQVYLVERPITHDQTHTYTGQGMASILLQVGILMGLVLFLVRRWGRALMPGSLTLVLTVNAVLMTWMHDLYLPTGPYPLIAVAALAGIAADLLLRWLAPSAARAGRFRLFAFATPGILYALYFTTLMLTVGIWWTVHMWAGAIVMAGIVGWLLSYLAVPPAKPAESA